MGRPPLGKIAMTSTERSRRHRLKHRPEQPTSRPSNDATLAHIAELEREVARLAAENAALKAELHDTIMASSRFAPKQRKPKTERPPLPPDEERDRIIKGLKTRVQNLRLELHYTREWHKGKADGSMSFQTMSAIAKTLHPDRTPSEAERAEACKLFTAWKSDRDKARRQAR
jgi:hypothetical protein